MATQLRTNRDLYLFVLELIRRHSTTDCSLEQYLTALHHLGAAHRAASAISLACFAGLLEDAFSVAVPPAAPTTSSDVEPLPEGYRLWEQTILSQIVDLREMREAGILDDKLCFLGVNAPRGARWYNFHPCGYLECAAEGGFGGWREADDTGRAYVPGEVAVLDAQGHVVAMDPRELDKPIRELDPVRWEQLTEFLNAGQLYE